MAVSTEVLVDKQCLICEGSQPTCIDRTKMKPRVLPLLSQAHPHSESQVTASQPQAPFFRTEASLCGQAKAGLVTMGTETRALLL